MKGTNDWNLPLKPIQMVFNMHTVNFSDTFENWSLHSLHQVEYAFLISEFKHKIPPKVLEKILAEV